MVAATVLRPRARRDEDGQVAALAAGDIIKRRGYPITGEVTRLQLYGMPSDPRVAIWVRHDTGNPSIWLGYRWRDGAIKARDPRDQLELVAPACGQLLLPVWGDDRQEQILKNGGAYAVR